VTPARVPTPAASTSLRSPAGPSRSSASYGSVNHDQSRRSWRRRAARRTPAKADGSSTKAGRYRIATFFLASAFLRPPTSCSRNRRKTTQIDAGPGSARCIPHDTMDKRFVYILRSLAARDRRYVGLTANVARRLDAHNQGLTPSTARCRPWALSVSIEFTDQERAVRFERYLKSPSGRAFARRHLAVE
jgi:putative endonuclease